MCGRRQLGGLLKGSYGLCPLWLSAGSHYIRLKQLGGAVDRAPV